MTTFKTEVRNTIAAANPLNSEEFRDEVRKSHLLYDDSEKLPRKIDIKRQITNVWEGAHCEDGQPFELRFNNVAEPNFHAILAEAMASIDMDRDPDLEGSALSARKTLDVLCRRRIKEVGLEAAHEEVVREYLLAVEQLAKDGFTGKSVFMIVYIAALHWLDVRLSKAASR